MGERALYRYIPPIFPQSGLADWTAGAGPYRFPGVSPNCVFCLIVGRAARQVEFGLPGSCSSKEVLPLSLPGEPPYSPAWFCRPEPNGAFMVLPESQAFSALLSRSRIRMAATSARVAWPCGSRRFPSFPQLLRIGPLHSPGCPGGGIRTVGKIL